MLDMDQIRTATNGSDEALLSEAINQMMRSVAMTYLLSNTALAAMAYRLGEIATNEDEATQQLLGAYAQYLTRMRNERQATD